MQRVEGMPTPKKVMKPWGCELVWSLSEYVIKILTLDAKAQTSLQVHEEKHETMFVYTGHPTLQIGASSMKLSPGALIDVPAGTVHRISASSQKVRILEVSTYSSDGDVVRLEDDYGRGTGLTDVESVDG